MDENLTLPEIRKAIDDADEILLRALSARFRAVSYLKRAKKAGKLKIEDPDRERMIKEQWAVRAKELDVPPELALLILDFILTESKRIQSS